MEIHKKLIIQCPLCHGEHKIRVILPPTGKHLFLICPKTGGIFRATEGEKDGFGKREDIGFDYWNNPDTDFDSVGVKRQHSWRTLL